MEEVISRPKVTNCWKTGITDAHRGWTGSHLRAAQTPGRLGSGYRGHRGDCTTPRGCGPGRLAWGEGPGRLEWGPHCAPLLRDPSRRLVETNGPRRGGHPPAPRWSLPGQTAPQAPRCLTLRDGTASGHRPMHGPQACQTTPRPRRTGTRQELHRATRGP